MDSVSSSTSTIDLFKRILFPVLQSAVVESLLLAHNSLLSLLVTMPLADDEANTTLDLILTDKRFPLGELKRVEKPAEENKDAGDSDGDDDDDDNDQEDDDDDNEDDDDDDNEEDSDGEANGGESSDDDDDDEDDNEDDDDDEDDDEDEDEDEEEEEEETQPPSKRKK